ncbi:hypothetical protein CYLTODRAFT_127178 [Cylindrobasidium torrendii FP15055 ss-10]|uniref:Uncharacterized protein n=1 Tax=Cylindrobasidium torrendii FP15055 ss-10 TaxID=1314674 RepID=A0A0D7B0K0_9AGAR|nr:hypothetical protein CYLTODRAFT_127178 [Cylindrobasidium torrendii FP15055 ss-10]
MNPNTRPLLLSPFFISHHHPNLSAAVSLCVLRMQDLLRSPAVPSDCSAELIDYDSRATGFKKLRAAQKGKRGSWGQLCLRGPSRPFRRPLVY